MRVIEFNIPTTDGIEQARGAPVWFSIGARRIKFMLQYDSDGKAKYLTHFASGYRFGRLDDAAIELMCKYSPHHRFNKKELARFLINKAVYSMGIEKVLERMDSMPVINLTHKQKDK